MEELKLRALCSPSYFRGLHDSASSGKLLPKQTLVSWLQVLEYIDEAMPPETPLAFGLHPNAEIGFKLREAERFCANVLCLQPREAGGEGGMSVEEKAKMVGLTCLQPPKRVLSACLHASACPDSWCLCISHHSVQRLVA